MSNKAISYYLDKYQSGRCSYRTLVRKISACGEPQLPGVSSPRILGCFHIYLRPENFRFGFHLLLPLFLLRPAVSIARKQMAKKNKQLDQLPKVMFNQIIRLLKSKNGRFRVDVKAADGTRVYIKNGNI